MKYQFNKNKNLGGQAVAILAAQADKARKLLERYEAHPVESVHGARRAFKRCRSLLQLIRDADPYMANVEKRFCRDLGRRLSPVRDADAIRETAAALDAWQGGRYVDEIRALHRYIAQATLQDKRQLAESRRAVNAALEDVKSALKRYTLLTIPTLTCKQLLARLSQARRRFRRGYRHACVAETAEAYHGWRKAAKRLDDHLQLCSRISSKAREYDRTVLKQILQTLGRHQDYEVLRNRLRANPAALRRSDQIRVLGMLDDAIACERSLAKEQMQVHLGGR
jgi:CHAD domain-containing protein